MGPHLTHGSLVPASPRAKRHLNQMTKFLNSFSVHRILNKFRTSDYAFVHDMWKMQVLYQALSWLHHSQLQAWNWIFFHWLKTLYGGSPKNSQNDWYMLQWQPNNTLPVPATSAICKAQAESQQSMVDDRQYSPNRLGRLSTETIVVFTVSATLLVWNYWYNMTPSYIQSHPIFAGNDL